VAYDVLPARPAARRSAIRTIVAAWLAAGTLDISAAVVYYPLTSGVRVMSLLQGIAAGVLGTGAAQGGVATAAVGLAFHYAIAFIWTVLFYAVARRVTAILRHVFPTGMLYGVFVWLVMNLIVVPLSNARHAPFTVRSVVTGAVILMFCVGLPIVAIVKRAPEFGTR
jgi:hypothetical protein